MKLFYFSSKALSASLIVFGVFFYSNFTFGQIALPISFPKENVLETKMYDYTKVPAYIKLKSGQYNLEAAIQIMENYFQPKGEVKLQLLNQEQDEIGFTHYRYQQIYKNYPVFGSMYIFHVKGGYVESINGFLYDEIQSNSVQISEFTALSNSLDYINAKQYKWQDAQEEAFLKEINNDPNATYFPKGEMQIISKGGDFYTKNPTLRLCYVFKIETKDPDDVKEVFVDASNGEIVFTNQILMHANTNGKAKTGYSDTQNIVTDQTGPNTYVLRETNRGGFHSLSGYNGSNIYTYNYQNQTAQTTTNFSDADNFWNNVNANWDEYATDAHWGAEMTYDYYRNKHNRNSIDNKGIQLRSRVHYDVKSFANASWNGQYMSYGDANGKPFTALDIAGHEITHGLTSNTSKLIYANESGALNESFSDIFGVAIDYYARPNKANWAIGDELGLALRSMSNPKTTGDPNYYFGINWYPLTTNPNQLNDQGGVHTNSSVQNFWFYLLSEGGSGKNDKNLNYFVKGIGVDSAAKIAYRTNAFYLFPSAKYGDAYFYSLKSTEDLYGICSEAYRSNLSAWSAIGFGKPGSPTNTPDFTTNKVEGCSLPFIVNLNSKYYNKSTNWRIERIGPITGDSNSIFIYEFGTYTVTMITDDGCKVDSITKPNLLTVAPPSPPQGINGNRIDAGSVILSSIKDTGLIEWYDAPKDGNLLDVNDEFATPPITRTTYYYIQKSVPGPLSAVGPKDNTLGTGSYVSTAGSSNYIVFNCLKASTLVSIVVYSQQSKPRTFQLRNATGDVLQEQNIQVGTGKQTVNLNFNLPIQDDLRLTILDTETPQLYKNTAGVLYPYVLQDMLIIKSSGTPSEYPFFYNWTIQDAPCVSERVLVKAIINNLEDNRILTLNDNIKVYPNPSSDYFFIEQTGLENYQSFMLTDVQGRIVLRGSLTGSEKSKIDITSLTNGIYQLKLTGYQLEDLNHKMIIE